MSSLHRMATEVIKMKKQKNAAIKLGKEQYGKMKMDEAFRKALEPYFKKDEKRLNMTPEFLLNG